LVKSKINVCPCCGHPVPPTDVLGILTPFRQRIFVLVQQAGTAGINATDLAEVLYANARNGGPVNAGQVVSITKKLINQQIAKFGIKIESKLGRGGRYWLRAL
jgi:hypothetical protein